VSTGGEARTPGPRYSTDEGELCRGDTDRVGVRTPPEALRWTDGVVPTLALAWVGCRPVAQPWVGSGRVGYRLQATPDAGRSRDEDAQDVVRIADVGRGGRTPRRMLSPTGRCASSV